MLTKMQARKYIDDAKYNYNKTNNKNYLIEAAMLKGLYLAKGGTKGIPLPNKLDIVILASKIVFTYRIKLSTCTSKDKAFEYLYKSLLKSKRQPEYYIHNDIPSSDNELAELMCEIITREITEDLILNRENLYIYSFKNNENGG